MLVRVGDDGKLGKMLPQTRVSCGTAAAGKTHGVLGASTVRRDLHCAEGGAPTEDICPGEMLQFAFVPPPLRRHMYLA